MGTPESETLEFKQAYAPNQSLEMARDVAQFANHLGGSLIIGPNEKDNCLVGYPGIDNPLNTERQIRERHSDA